ncbi:hypothetical protein ACET3Z_028255 [Daucus carota]
MSLALLLINDADPTSATTFDAISPVGKAPPITSPPAPEKAKDQAPLLSPSSTPTPSQPSKFSSPTTSPGIAPYVPPSASQGQPPPTKGPELAPEDPGKQLNNN